MFRYCFGFILYLKSRQRDDSILFMIYNFILKTKNSNFPQKKIHYFLRINNFNIPILKKVIKARSYFENNVVNFKYITQ